jgi:hypothetical protein
MPRPDLTRVPAYYHNYISKVQKDDLGAIFVNHQRQFLDFLGNIPAERWAHAYATGKWTIKELVQHVIDTERIFSYRALCIARKDATSLPGFDENTYVENSKAGSRTKVDLIAELQSVQRASATLFASFDEEQLESSGIANGKPIYVLGIAYILVGHTLHHMDILKERYLQ